MPEVSALGLLSSEQKPSLSAEGVDAYVECKENGGKTKNGVSSVFCLVMPEVSARD